MPAPFISQADAAMLRPISRPVVRVIIGLLAAYGVLALLTDSRPATFKKSPTSARTRSSLELPVGSDVPYDAAATANLTAFRSQLLRRWVQSWKVPALKVAALFSASDWEFFSPVIMCPKDRPLRKYGGTGDGSKLLCDLGTRRLQRDCIIYSLGSKGNFKFEESMLEETDWKIHTFDCTYNGSSIHPGRHFYHQVCIGSRPDNPRYKPYSELVRTLGHKEVDLLKMDIEGWEYEVFGAFKADDPLPAEISTELHILKPQAKVEPPHPLDAAGLSLVFLHLANLGYGAYSLEVNPIHPNCCAEFSFMRFWPLA